MIPNKYSTYSSHSNESFWTLQVARHFSQCTNMRPFVVDRHYGSLLVHPQLYHCDVFYCCWLLLLSDYRHLCAIWFLHTWMNGWMYVCTREWKRWRKNTSNDTFKSSTLHIIFIHMCGYGVCRGNINWEEMIFETIKG
jgi:hypothetical protein